MGRLWYHLCCHGLRHHDSKAEFQVHLEGNETNAVHVVFPACHQCTGRDNRCSTVYDRQFYIVQWSCSADAVHRCKTAADDHDHNMSDSYNKADGYDFGD